MAKVASGQTLRSAERLLQVLNCFDAEHAALSVPEIAHSLALAPSTVRRLLQTLEREGFLRLEPDSGRYRLDLAVLHLAAAALAGSSLVQAAAPLLDALRDRLGEAVHLTLRDGADLVIVDHRPSRHMMKAFHSIGHRYTAYRGSAAGKVLLAWLPEAELAALLPPSGRWDAPTERGIGDTAALRVALAQTRERGHAHNEAETEAGVWSVAAPVRDHRGAVVAALTVPCPESRLTDDRKVLIAQAVTETARDLSAMVPFAA